MANEGDLGSAYEEAERSLAITNALRAMGPRLPATGRCHFCEESLAGDKLFCDADCAEDHEYERQRRTVNVRLS